MMNVHHTSPYELVVIEMITYKNMHSAAKTTVRAAVIEIESVLNITENIFLMNYIQHNVTK